MAERPGNKVSYTNSDMYCIHIYFIELLKGSQNKMDLAGNFSFLYLDLLRTRYRIAGNFRGGGGGKIFLVF